MISSIFSRFPTPLVEKQSQTSIDPPYRASWWELDIPRWRFHQVFATYIDVHLRRQNFFSSLNRTSSQAESLVFFRSHVQISRLILFLYRRSGFFRATLTHKPVSWSRFRTVCGVITTLNLFFRSRTIWAADMRRLRRTFLWIIRSWCDDVARGRTARGKFLTPPPRRYYEMISWTVLLGNFNILAIWRSDLCSW
jgi:hypothetical protein